MTDVLRGQVWRNVLGTFVRIDGVGPCQNYPDERVLWVEECDEWGDVIGDRIPMVIDWFPGSLWALVKEAS